MVRILRVTGEKDRQMPERTIVVIGRNDLIRRGVSEALGMSTSFRIVASERDWGSVAVRARRTPPDAALVVSDAPDIGSDQLLQTLREEIPGTRLFVIATRHPACGFEVFFRSGASALLMLEDIDSHVLHSTLVAVLEGNLVLTSQTVVDQHLDEHPYRTPSPTPKPDIAAEDLFVLQQLARGLTVAELAKANHLSVRTVNRIVERLMEHLDAATRFELAVKATLIGIVP